MNDQPGIRWHDRVFVAGYTGSGKSEVLNLLFSQVRCQKVLLDTKPEFSIPDVVPTRSPEELHERLKSDPVIHYVDSSGDVDEYDEVFYECHHKRNLLVCCHELADLCEDQPGRAPKWVRAALRKGNIFGNGLYGGSQRPVGMPRQARTEAQHVIHMVPELDPEDHKILQRMMQLSSPRELSRILADATELSPTGQHSFAWYDRRARNLTFSPPLPDHVRKRILVRRHTNLT